MYVVIFHLQNSLLCILDIAVIIIYLFCSVKYVEELVCQH